MCITGNLPGDGEDKKEIPHPFYSQVDAAHHIHVFRQIVTNLQVERPDNIISTYIVHA